MKKVRLNWSYRNEMIFAIRCNIYVRSHLNVKCWIRMTEVHVVNILLESKYAFSFKVWRVTIACILIWYYSMPFSSLRILCLGGIHQTGKNIWTELRSVMSPKYQIRIQLLQWREWNRRSGTENSSIGNILVLMFQKYFMDITPKEDRFPFGTQSPTRMCPPCCL